jgi:hypothetical protein
MQLEDAVEDLDDEEDPSNKHDKKKRGRKRRFLVTQLKGEKQSLLYVEKQVAVMEGGRQETPPDSSESTTFPPLVHQVILKRLTLLQVTVPRRSVSEEFSSVKFGEFSSVKCEELSSVKNIVGY